MFDLDRWQEIWQTITQNKMRSVMTAFGVFWGIFMLVIMAGSGNGLATGMSEGIDGLAQNSMFLFSSRTTEPYKGFQKGRYWNMRTKDLEVVKSKVEGVNIATPMLFGGSRQPKNTIRGDKSGSYNIKGLHPDYAQIDKPTILYGRYLNQIDIQQKRKVVLLGKKVYEDLYRIGEDPVGTTVKVNGIYYTVVGVIDGVANLSINGRISESVILPFTTMQLAYNYGDNVHVIMFSSKPGCSISKIEDQIKQVIKKEHTISPTDEEALDGYNIERQFLMYNNLFLGIQILIIIVGFGTLFAGIVGVSNIMMVTIRERTQEIGIRRALGATPMTILSQIMMESLVITLIAGILGLSMGVFTLNLVDTILSAQPADAGGDTFFKHPGINLQLAVYSMLVLVAAGLLAGLVPAKKALRIKAIDALRDE